MRFGPEDMTPPDEHSIETCEADARPWTPDSGLPPLATRDTSKSAEQQGLFLKFEVSRTDGSSAPGGKHYGCEYFVLDTDHDPMAIPALAVYAMVAEDTHPALAADLRARYSLPNLPSLSTRTHFTSQILVLANLLNEALGVVKNVEAEGGDEAELLQHIITQGDAALAAVLQEHGMGRVSHG